MITMIMIMSKTHFLIVECYITFCRLYFTFQARARFECCIGVVPSTCQTNFIACLLHEHCVSITPCHALSSYYFSKYCVLNVNPIPLLSGLSCKPWNKLWYLFLTANISTSIHLFLTKTGDTSSVTCSRNWPNFAEGRINSSHVFVYKD